MNNRERALAALRWEKPDRVPYFEQGVASNVASQVLGRKALTGGGRFRRDGIEAAMRGSDAYEEYLQRHIRDWGDLAEACQFDVITPPWHGGGVPSKKLDENTYFFGDPDGDWEVQRYSPESDTLHMVDSNVAHEGLAAIERRVRATMKWADQPRDPPRFPVLKALLERFKGRRAVAGGAGIAVPISAPWLEAMRTRPDLIEDYLDATTQAACRDIEALGKLGVDLIWGGGDLATNFGPVYSPADFRRFILPRLKMMVKACHDNGLAYFFRTDGWLWPIVGMLFEESGADGYGEIDAQAGMDLAEIRARFPRLMLWGNVDCAGALVKGTPDDVAAETRACIEKVAATGGYFCGSSNVIHCGVPADNFLAIGRTCRECGRY